MKTYLITMIVLGSLTVVVRLLLLAFSDYPRITENSQAFDVLSLVVSTALLIWAISLLP